MQCEEWDDANSELFKEPHDEAVHKNSYKNRLYELISASLELCVFRRPRNRASSISVMTASIIAVVSVLVVLVETVLMASIVVMFSVLVVFVKMALMASIVVMFSVPVVSVKAALMVSIVVMVSAFVILVETALMALIAAVVSVPVVLAETMLAASIIVMVSVSVILVKTAFMMAFIGMVIILIAALEGGAAVPEIFTSFTVLHFIGRGGGFFRPGFFLHAPVDDRAIGTVRID